MVPSEKCLGEFPELLQVGGLPITLTATRRILPIQRFSQENLTSTLNKQDHIYCIAIGQGMRRTKNKLITGEINCEIKEEPPKLGKIKINNNIVPNLLKKFSTPYAYFLVIILQVSFRHLKGGLELS